MNELGNTPADKNYKPSGISRAEEAALEAYPPIATVPRMVGVSDGKVYDPTSYNRGVFIEGYEQAEKDLAPAFEFLFDVPNNDGFLVFTPMENQTIRKKLKLKKGERIIVSIRKEK